MDHLVLVDGHHLLYRAYWAIPRTMRTSQGVQVNMAFGIASMVLQILRVEEPTHLLFCFDADEDTFRHKEYAEYKAGRAATPDDFYPQVPHALRVLDALSIKQVSGGGYEADDFACAYALSAMKRGMRTTIVTGDRDLLQLASPSIRIAIPHKGYQEPQYMDPAAVLAKYGIPPSLIPAYKGLMGDSSDNLPGVRGIGPKTASELLQTYGSLEEIYRRLDDIRPAVREKLRVDKDAAFFCQRMATLVGDFPLPISLDHLTYASIPSEAILSCFQSMEFTLPTRRFMQLLHTPYGKKIFLATGESLTSPSPEPSMTIEQMSFL